MGYKNRRIKSIRMTDSTIIKLQELAEHYKHDYWFNRKMGYNFKKVTSADVIEHLVHEDHKRVNEETSRKT